MKDGTYEGLARLGFVARGVVYLLVGGLAVLAALGPGGATTGSKGALATLLGEPLGWGLLGAICLGLFCFAAWRFAQSILNADRLGDSWKERMRRVGFGVSATVNVALAISAAGLLIGVRVGSSDDETAARDWTAWLLSMPFGQWIVGLIGAGVAFVGVGVALRAWKANFEDRLDGGGATQGWVRVCGQAGFFARAFVLMIIGGFLIAAAWSADAGEARGVAGALRSLQMQPYGWVLLAVTASGLFMFGLFQFVIAWYRRIEVPECINGGGSWAEPPCPRTMHGPPDR